MIPAAAWALSALVGAAWAADEAGSATPAEVAEEASEETPAEPPGEAPAESADDAPALDLPPHVKAFQGVVEGMEAAAAAMVDATYTFHKMELVSGNLLPAEQCAVKYRAPNDFYMKWIGSVDTGQELLFKPGWNEDRMQVSAGPLVPTVNLSVDSRLAARTNRHTIRHAPLPTIVQNFVRDEVTLTAAAAIPEIQELGARMVYGEASRCYLLELPKDELPTLYATRVELCVSDRTRLPTRIQAWDVEGGVLQLVEDYGYEALRVNVGLTDADFDPDNKAYNF